MSDIKEWLLYPLLKLEKDVHRETGTKPRIEVTVHSHLFADLVNVCDIRYGTIVGIETPIELRIGHDIIVKPWPQSGSRAD